MAIDFKALSKEMGAAMAAVLKGEGKEVVSKGRAEVRRLADTLEQITTGVLSGAIKPERAAFLLKMQKDATKTVLLGIAGMEALVAEKAINDALGVAKGAVNRAVGFPLL